MRSPFTETYTAPATTEYRATPSLTLESPLLDPAQMGRQRFTTENEPAVSDSFTAEEEVPVFAAEKAVRLNQQYEKQLWGKDLPQLLAYFIAGGFLPAGHAGNDARFARAVAGWQSTVFSDAKSRDGILGPASWAVLKTRLAAKPAPSPAAVIKTSRWKALFPDAVPSEAEPLVHGRDTFRHMVNAIRTAENNQHFIYLLGWMVDIDFELVEGEQSSTLYNLIKAAAARGVEVRLQVWDNHFYHKELGIAMKYLNPLPNVAMVKDNATYGSPALKAAISLFRSRVNELNLKFPLLNLSDRWKELVRDINIVQNEGSHHEKILVVNGREGLVAFCGGIDINPDRREGKRNRQLPENADESQKENFKWLDSGCFGSDVLHDVHCKLKGPAAATLLQRFVQRWQTFVTLRGLPYPPLRATILKPAVPAGGNAQMPFVKIAHTFNHPTDPSRKERTIKEAVRTAISHAEQSIHIEDQYMISLEIAGLVNSRLHAHKNNPNFKVTLVTQDDSFAGADIQFPQVMRKKLEAELLRGFAGTDLAAAQQKIAFTILEPCLPTVPRHKVHSKLYIIDNELAIIGSANCSSRSMTHDTETAAVLFANPGTNPLVQQLAKGIFEPFTRKYTPNPNFRDKDLAVIAELNNLSTLKGKLTALSGIVSPVLPATIPAIANAILSRLKPVMIDIIDPDADNTQPQQEMETALYAPETGHEALEATGQRFETEFALLEQYGKEDGTNQPGEAAAYAREALPAETAWESGQEPEQLTQEAGPPFPAMFSNEFEATYSQAAPPSDAEIAGEIEYQAAVAKAAPAACEGHICWAKEVLNRLLNTQLTPNNTPDKATINAIADFQAKNNLPVTQKLDAATERALLEADALRRTKGTVWQGAAIAVITAAKTKLEDWTAKAVNNKPQFILNSYRDPRKVYAFVLHQMAFKRRSRKTNQYSDPESYLSTGAHFCIFFDGRIVQLHPFSRMIWHANCLSPRSVGVEFEGNFPNTKGRWWVDKKAKNPDKDLPTQAQFSAGKFLAAYLKIVLGTTHILAHRQGSKDRENDPGPAIWYEVGQWAVEKLGMSDGGASFKCGDGYTLLPEWRTWGNQTGTTVQKETTEEPEMAWEGISTEEGPDETASETAPSLYEAETEWEATPAENLP